LSRRASVTPADEAREPAPLFRFVASSDHPGWIEWDLPERGRFNDAIGPLLVRLEDGMARVRMTPGRQHSNLADAVHGGAMLAFVDLAIFAAARAFGLLEAGVAVTLDLSAQFIGRAVLGVPIEARIELLRETGGLLFERGLVVQPLADATETVLSFTATIRKARLR